MSKIITDLSCRVCLNVEELMVHIYEEVEDLNSDLSSLLELCGGLKVDKTDSYPKYLCKECTSELLIAAKFRDKCNKTKEILTQIEIDIIESEPSSINEKNALLQTNNIPDQTINQQLVKIEEFEVISPTVESSESICYNEQSMSYEAPADMIVYGGEFGSDEIDVDTTIVHDIAPPWSAEIVSSSEKQCKTKALKYSCDICGAVFAYAQNLTRHLNKMHSPSQLYNCEICGHKFSLEENFYEHCATHKSADVMYINKKVERNKCEYCNKECKSQFALNMHIRTHTNERPFSCEVCDKSFKSNSALKGHSKRHTGVRDFNCSICNKSFFEQNNLKTHMLTHTGEKPHTCTVCGRRFSRVFLLQLHMRTHTGEKPYTCPYCDRSFAQLCDSKNHIRTHTGERQFKCPACVKNFTKRKALILHMHSNHSTLEMIDGSAEESKNTSIFLYEEISNVNINDHVKIREDEESIVDVANESSLGHLIVKDLEENF